MADIKNLVEEIVGHVDSGDLMTALSFFESEIRPVVEATDEYENPEMLDILREQCTLIDDEEWNSVLINVEKLKGMLDA
jgi:hypothetical protein